MAHGVDEWRMLVLDLDGTAVRADGTLSPADVGAARMLRDAGVIVTVATGRIFSGAVEDACELGVGGIVACADGSELVDLQTGDVRRASYVQPEDREHVREAFLRHGLAAAMLTTHHVHHEAAASAHEPLLRMWSTRLVAHPRFLETELWADTVEVAAVLGLGDASASESVTLELRESRAFLQAFYVRDYDGERSFVKVRRAGIDKGTALRMMAEEHGLAPGQVVAAGDWFNDVPMLRAAGRSFAVRDAPGPVQAAATHRLEAGKGEGGVVAEIARRVWGIDAA